MSQHSSATLGNPPPLSASRTGLGWGLLGVAAFSFTLPLTRIALAGGGLSPLFIGSSRAVIAAVLAAAALLLTRQRLPSGRQWVRLAVIAGGVVFGFPLLTSFALTTAPASHGAVVVGLLPAATAVAAVLRGHERPPLSFWVMAGAGAGAVLVFATFAGGGMSGGIAGGVSGGLGGGFGGLHWSDLLLLGAVLCGAVGYAEGGLLSRELGAWQTVSWALVLSAPVMMVLTGVSAVRQPPTGTAVEWAALGYLGVVSMFLGFLAWYRGLAIGPMAQVSQVQLVQPVLSICWAALLLHEQLTWPTVLGGAAVILCAAVSVRIRLRR